MTPLHVYGIDFTSAPGPRKPITCAHATLTGDLLTFEHLHRWTEFDTFERHLRSDGPWITGIDSPFAQSERLVRALDWPESWSGYVRLCGALERKEFRSVLTEYRNQQPAGQKHHKRVCDVRANSQSPQTIDYTPVGLMFHEVAPRLLRTGVHVPVLQESGSDRVVVEAYPGLLVRTLIGKSPYKSDTPAKQSKTQARVRRDLLGSLLEGACRAQYGFDLEAPMKLADDPSGDELDALLCAIQAAWAWGQRSARYGTPTNANPLEGWISDPALT